MKNINKINSFKKIPKDENQFSKSFIKNSCALMLQVDEDGDNKKFTVGYTNKTSRPFLSTLMSAYSCREKKRELNFIKINYNEFYDYACENFGIANKKNENIESEKQANITELTDDGAAVNLANSIIRAGIERNASDIHIESNKENASIKYRINGILETEKIINLDVFNSLSARLKILSNLNILEKRLGQDGRITVNYEGKNIDLRASFVPLSDGESIVLRILGNENKKQKIEELGFSKNNLEDIFSMIKIPHGLILVTGPTGSGKSTTLNSILEKLNDGKRKIITIEDPVEFNTEGINQIQVNEEIGFTFSNILKKVLRQDPDIIMVGEIRDNETCELCIKAALTGHLVISTLHTNDAASVITRLKNMGVKNYLISSVLKGVISQRLVKNKDNSRTVIAETFCMTGELENLINNDATESEIKKCLLKNNFIPIQLDAKNKIKNGLIIKEDALSQIELDKKYE